MLPPIFKIACPHALAVNPGHFSQGYDATPLQAVRILFRWVGAFHIREVDYLVLLSDIGVTYPFHPPFCLALPTMTQFCDWSHSSWVHYPPASMGIDIIPSALCMCSFQGLQPSHITCGLHPSSLDAPVDIHCRSHNFPFFYPREALLVGQWVTSLPLSSCGILFFSPPTEVVLHGMGMVHLSHVWELPIHKGMPISDTMRRSQFWWRTHDHPHWFVTL